VTVKTGDKVEAGAKLGEVGYSGLAAFPHVHLSVSKDDRSVDPFLADAKAPCGEGAPSLWSASAKAALPYKAGELLGLGFADHAIAIEELEEGATLAAPSRDTPMVVYMWAINLRKGDTITLALKSGDIVLADNAETLDHDKAQVMYFVGKKAPAGGWPAGSYTGEVTITRDGKPAMSETRTLTIE
jgi:Peptidase family M23